MGATAFDTLTAAREMEKAGLDRAAAEAIAGAIRSGQGDLATKADLDALAQSTKADLGEMKAELRGDMDTRFAELRGEMSEMKAELRGEMSEMKAELRGEMGEIRTELRWMKAIGGAIVALLVALLVLAGRIAFTGAAT